MRVYELAKKLGLESRGLIPELVRLGIEVTSHSNALGDDDVKKAMTALAGNTSFPSEKKELSQSDRRTEAVPKSVKKQSVRGRRSREEQEEDERQAKPEKKHILIKRKKEEVEPDSEDGESPLLEADFPAEGGAEVGRETPLPSFDLENPEIVAVAEALAASPEEPGSEGMVKLTEGPSLGQLPSQEKREVKEGEVSKEKGAGEEKPKKIKRVGKPRNEDIMAKRYEDAARWQDLRPLPSLRREDRSRHAPASGHTEITKPRRKTVKLSPGVTVKEFAELLSLRAAEVIQKLMEVGVGLTLNQPMDLDAGLLIAEGCGIHTEVVEVKQGEALLEDVLDTPGDLTLVSRAPVVTIMGHVDHGKTSLLDAIRKTHVTDQEAGGITQHIGAYSVQVGEKHVTFLDTPGHEAFTAMRARGAQCTDIVVLVVAADDGVMPQTVEAANHAQAANVPIIVAVNKIDKPGANPDRIKQGLSEHGLLPESWGGQTIYVEVSAKEKQGLDTLLDMILLQAEVMELKADIEQPAKGIVLEAKLDRGRGPVATVLVQSGKLHVGTPFVVGTTSGRVRAMVSHDGSKVREAGPSTPVEVIGLLALPAAGDQFLCVKDERMAREVAEARLQKQRSIELGSSGTRLTLEDLLAQGQEQEKKECSVVIKADTQGSLGALCEAIQKISTDAVNVQILHSGVGGITESDVLLASASKALVFGFHIRPEPKASALAERENVQIRLHTIIYNVLSDVKAAAEGLLDPTLTERVLGRAEVRQIFSIPKFGSIAGCYVTDGHIARSCEGVRVLRDHVLVYEGKLGSLRRFKDDVRDVQQGYECGIAVENFNDLKNGDVIEAYVLDKTATKLVP